MDNMEKMLEEKIWAVVGATDNQEKFGCKIFKAMREAGLEVYPVNPGVKEIFGDKCYASLKELPVKPAAVNVVVPPRVGEQIVRECSELGINNVWFQPGADGETVVDLAKQLSLTAVDHACIMKELKKRGNKK